MTRPMKPKASRGERDERIVAEAGPWKLRPESFGVYPADETMLTLPRLAAAKALQRIANRISKRAKGAK